MLDVGKLLGIDKIEKVLSRFVKKPVKMLPEQCYTYRDRSFTCDKCIKICPLEAISFNGSFILDDERCNGCGLCYNTCPTGAFELLKSNESLLAQIKLFLESGNAIIFKCSKTIVKDDNGNVDHPPALETICLGRLDESILLGAAALGADAVWLDSSACSECELNVRPLIEETVNRSQRILGIFNRNATIAFSDNPPSEIILIESESKPDLTVLEIESRRDFFTKIGRNLMASGTVMVGERLDAIMESVSPTEKEPFSSHLPTKRALLLAILRRLGDPTAPVSSDDSIFCNVEIGVNCIFCYNCVTFCPTSALRKTTSEQPGIEFVAASCVDCGLCEFVCPNKSITYNREIEWRRLLNGEKELLVESRTCKCKRCHLTFETVDETEFCYACRLKQSKLDDDSWY